MSTTAESISTAFTTSQKEFVSSVREILPHIVKDSGPGVALLEMNGPSLCLVACNRQSLCLAELACNVDSIESFQFTISREDVSRLAKLPFGSGDGMCHIEIHDGKLRLSFNRSGCSEKDSICVSLSRVSWPKWDKFIPEESDAVSTVCGRSIDIREAILPRSIVHIWTRGGKKAQVMVERPPQCLDERDISVDGDGDIKVDVDLLNPVLPVSKSNVVMRIYDSKVCVKRDNLTFVVMGLNDD